MGQERSCKLWRVGVSCTGSVLGVRVGWGDWKDGRKGGGGKAHTGERMDGPGLLGSTSYGPGIVTLARA